MEGDVEGGSWYRNTASPHVPLSMYKMYFVSLIFPALHMVKIVFPHSWPVYMTIYFNSNDDKELCEALDNTIELQADQDINGQSEGTYMYGLWPWMDFGIVHS